MVYVTIINILIISYLSIGIILGLLSLFVMHEASKHTCDDEQYQQLNFIMDRVKVVSSKPYLFVFLMTSLMWPKMLSNLGKNN
jgi:hypothetical protein